MGMLSSAWCSPGPSIGSASSPALIPDRDTGPHGQWRLIPSWGRKSWLDNWHWVPPRELQDTAGAAVIAQTPTNGCADIYVCWMVWTHGHSLS